MTVKTNVPFIFVAMTICLCGTSFGSMALSQNDSGSRVVLSAADVLPKSLLTGPNYRVKETVINDGMINTYELDTHYGPIRVESTVVVLKRINELKAISRIEELKGTGVYLRALSRAGIAPFKTAGGTITDPIGTVKGIGSGIRRFFQNLTTSVSGSSPYKDDFTNSLLGHSSYKREFAHQFNVDPYSTYEPLQKALNDLAWTAAAGGLTVSAALAAIPGTAVAVVSYASTAGSLKALVNEKTPGQLFDINRNRLYAMGVPVPIVNIFMRNTAFDPWEQTLLVGELANMTTVNDRKVFIKRAAGATEDPVVVFLRVQAQLIGLYAEKIKSVSAFVDINGFPFLMSNHGVMTGVFPIDHLAWTAGLARREAEISSAIKQRQDVTRKELLITGTVDPVARKALESRKWIVRDKYEEQILLKMGY